MPPENLRIAMDNLLPFFGRAGEEARADRQRRLAQQDLYVIHNPSSGLVKVGRSVNVRNRLNALQSGAGQVMELVKQFERKGFCETACHEKLSAWHTPPGKEWFNASPEQVLQVVEQVVRDTRELSEEEEEEEEEGDAEEAPGSPEAQSTRAPLSSSTAPAAENSHAHTRPSETLKRKREEVAMVELEAQAVEMEGRVKRARAQAHIEDVRAATEVARIALDTLRELGLYISDHDRTLAKNMITEAAFGAQSLCTEEGHRL